MLAAMSRSGGVGSAVREAEAVAAVDTRLAVAAACWR